MQISERDKILLTHIVQHCDEIKETIDFFKDDYSVFVSNKVYRNSCAMSILQIGELCGHLSLGFRKKFPEIPWQAIKGMRNIVVHAYGTVSIETVWETIHGDILQLKNFCLQFID